MPTPAVRDVRGTNYIVCESLTTHNFRHLLSSPGTFNATVMQAELDRLLLRGITVVRIFCSYWNFATDRANYDAVLKAISAKLVANGQKAQIVFFDGVTGSLQGGPEPWYDLFGRNGTQAWDPASPTNPGLYNGVDGLLDIWVVLDAAFSASLLPYPDMSTGGWLGTPGNLYVALYPHENTFYPHLPSDPGYGNADQIARHQALWTALKGWIDATISGLSDAGDAIWTIDLANEFAIADFGATAIYQPASAPILEEFPDALPDPAVDAGLAAITVATRRLAFMRWFREYLRDKHPTLEVTTGSLGIANMIVEDQALDLDFATTHEYVRGWIAGSSGTLDQMVAYRASSGKEVCMNEYGTTVEGARHIVRQMYEHQQRQIGSIMWGWFESNGFGFLVAPQHWAPAANPTATARFYPITGFERSNGSTPTFQTRRSDLYPIALDFFSGTPIAKLEEWLTILLPGWFSGARRFKVQDAAGVDLVPGGSTEVNWRRLAAGAALVDEVGQNASWVGRSPYTAWYPGIGQALDTPTQASKTGANAEYFDVPLEEILAAPDGVFLVNAWFGDMTYDPLSYETMILEASTPIAVSKYFLLTGAIVTSQTRYRFLGSADSQGIRLEQTHPAFEGRRFTWITAPVHEPGYFVSDASVLTRSVGHTYVLPPPDAASGLDQDGWGEPGESHLRALRPPSGFQNLCYRIRTSAPPGSDGWLELEVRGLDCLLREFVENVRVEVATGTTGDDRVWGEVAVRELRNVRIVSTSNLAGTSAVLEIGWTFDLHPTNPERSFEHVLVPTEREGVAVNRGWRVGFPVQLTRDSTQTGVKTILKCNEVDGVTMCNGDIKRTGLAFAETNEIHQGGSWGTDDKEFVAGTKMPNFESGVFDLAANTWQPAQYGRPVLQAGANAGENPSQLRWYAFLVNLKANILGGALQA